MLLRRWVGRPQLKRDPLGSSDHSVKPMALITTLALGTFGGGCSPHIDAERCAAAEFQRAGRNEQVDSATRILLTYWDKCITADLAAKALLDELQRTGQSFNAEMDKDLRRAIEREGRRRRLGSVRSNADSPRNGP